jgi:hypothetical protein
VTVTFETKIGEAMTKTCLDCRYLDIETIPQPGHPCLTCDGKTVSVKKDGSNFKAKQPPT